MGFNLPSEYLTEEIFKQLEQELEYLVKIKRREISKQLEESSSLGDLSENAEYQEAKEQQLRVERKIFELEDLLSRAVVISKNRRPKNKIDLGSRVVLKKIHDGPIFKYQIVSTSEANPFNNKISHESPLGTALIGKKKGDKVKVLTPGGEMGYTIIEIN